MPKLRIFGGRKSFAGPVDNATFNAASADDPAVGRLNTFSLRVLLTGELIAFAGIMLAFAAVLFWPDNPANLQGLGGRIYIPEGLAAAFDFTDPKMSTVRVLTDLAPISLKNTVIPVILLMGLAAIIRRRWMLTGLFFAFLLFPWTLIGFYFPVRPALLSIFGFILLGRTLPLPRYAILVLVPAAYLFGGPIISTMSTTIDAMLGEQDIPSERYRSVEFADLIRNEGKPAIEQRGYGQKDLVRISTLLGMVANPEEKAGHAYVAAQEFALRGELDAATGQLDIAESHGFAHSPFNARRFAVIRAHAIASGAFGNSAQAQLSARYNTHSVIASLVIVIGTALGLIGPFADIISSRIQRRVARIGDAQNRLDQQRAESYQPSQVSGLGFSAPRENIQSLAAIDGGALIAEISQRTKIYSVVALTFGGLALVCLYGSYAFWLPSPETNTAFARVGLVGATLGLVDQSDGGLDLGFIWDMMFPFSLGGLLLISLVFSRKHSRPILAALLVLVAMAQIQPFVPIRSSNHEVAASSISPQLRVHLKESAKAGGQTAMRTLQPKGAIRSMQPDPSLPAFPRVRTRLTPPKGTAALLAATAAPALPQINSSVAAYILAQIAYLEDRPADASQMLSYITQPDILRGYVHKQRAKLMVDWVEAQGYALPDQSLKSRTHMLTGLARKTGRVLPWFVIACGGVAAIALVLRIASGHRRRRMDSLVRQRLDFQLVEGKNF